MPLALQNVPNGQSRQLEEPVDGAYEPGGHTRQSEADVDPLIDKYLPAAQGVGLMVPSLGQ
jgi:hypothetical protein